MLAGLPHVLLRGRGRAGRRSPGRPSTRWWRCRSVLVLAAVRQLVTARETRRLYAEVERAAETRRELLAQLMQRTDEDRHRVAAQLHEQAVSAYASFVSFVQVHARRRRAATGRRAAASALVRDDLRDQAESLRQLMLAVRPLEVDRPRSTSLGTPDPRLRRRPVPRPAAAGARTSRWPTTSCSTGRPRPWSCASCRRPCATCGGTAGPAAIDVTVRGDGAVVEVCVTDDGVGFDPGAVLFESGIAAMRGVRRARPGLAPHREPPRAGHAGRGPPR